MDKNYIILKFQRSYCVGLNFERSQTSVVVKNVLILQEPIFVCLEGGVIGSPLRIYVPAQYSHLTNGEMGLSKERRRKAHWFNGRMRKGSDFLGSHCFFPSLLCFPIPRLTGQVWMGRIWHAGPWAPLLHTALTLNVMGSGVQAQRPLRFQSNFQLQTCQTRRHHKEQGLDQHLWSPTPPLTLKFRPSDHFTLGFLDKEPKKSISTVDSKSSP